MVFWPVKPLGPFEHVHEGKSKSCKYCRPEFDGVLFYGMKQKYFVSDMKYFVVVDIYFFVYNVLGGEFMYMSASQSCQKTAKETYRNER